MKLTSLARVLPLLLPSALFCGEPLLLRAAEPIRDVSWFLRRLRTVDYLPELENSHTALASTWDRSGGNADGTDFKRIEGATNILFDAQGPGCVHRLFTGGSDPATADTPGYLRVDGTRLQVFLDDAPLPLFDFPVTEFFDPARGPIPSPLAGGKAQGWTYPGCLFPLPYARHCRVQLVNPEKKNWGCYWQVAYTTYPPGTPVVTLAWPLDANARAELDQVCRDWRQFQSTPPPPPPKWTLNRARSLAPGQALEVRRSGAGVLREFRLSAEPASPEMLRGLRLQLTWDGSASPAVDVPLGCFFGYTDTGHAPGAQFSTLLLGVTTNEVYSRFPMPYANGAVIALRNESPVPAQVRLLLAADKLRALPPDWGRFHSAYLEAPAALDGGPAFGPKQVPCHLVLERQGRGKYVGVIMREDWPHEGWWGEGDWLIWTDETGWPPSYHGTGSEEYFNSGWCKFDRKAISGFVAVHPGHPTEYSFHLNDAFQFQRNIRIAVETMGWDKADLQIRQEHPVWGTTAFWYAAP